MFFTSQRKNSEFRSKFGGGFPNDSSSETQRLESDALPLRHSPLLILKIVVAKIILNYFTGNVAVRPFV